MKKVAFITEIAFLATVISACGGDSASNPETLTALSDESKPVEMSSSVREELSGDLSSSGRTQSSASISSSSSSAVAIGIDPSTVVAGTLTDSRDGQTYRTVKIGEQVWMAENLNYKVENSYCYNDENSNCDKHGRLYTWSAAITACPNGWHLPSKDEYGTLFLTVGGERIAGKMLKSTSGWSGDGNGTDVYSFAMLPGGVNFSGHDYQGEGEIATFWSIGAPSPTEYIEHIRAVEAGYDDLIFIGAEDFFFVADGDVITGLLVEEDGASVRCVEGELMDYIKFSSSSKEISSSSNDSNESSSSEKHELLIDSRDGQTYKTVTIGTQTWMAENLNYETPKSSCYDDLDSNCVLYGRLYEWEDAVGKTDECFYGIFCELPSGNIRGICPKKWHLPSQAEWETLISVVGGKSVAEKALKSASVWKIDKNGTDDFGFSVLPAGSREQKRLSESYEYISMGKATIFWSSSENHFQASFSVHFYEDRLSLFDDDKFFGFSVRCVKD